LVEKLQPPSTPSPIGATFSESSTQRNAGPLGLRQTVASFCYQNIAPMGLLITAILSIKILWISYSHLPFNFYYLH